MLILTICDTQCSSGSDMHLLGLSGFQIFTIREMQTG